MSGSKSAVTWYVSVKDENNYPQAENEPAMKRMEMPPPKGTEEYQWLFMATRRAAFRTASHRRSMGLGHLRALGSAVLNPDRVV